MGKLTLNRHKVIVAVLATYISLLAFFVFFPRPILESNDPLAIAEFVKTHTGFIYKILYADTQKVATANFFMLTPFVLISHWAYPRTKLTHIALTGIGFSLFIELAQILIPGRVSDIRDFIANTVSVLIGIFVSLIGRFLGINRSYS